MKGGKFNPIFTGATLSVLLVFAFSLTAPATFFSALSWIQDIFIKNVSHLYGIIIFSLFCLCLYLAFGPHRHLRIGRRTRPKYGTFTYLAMLFSAGMGTGLLFSGVYEPLYHYFHPPAGPGATPSARDLSFQLTFLHWGVAGWAVYTFMGLAVSHFAFQKKLPLRISSLLYPFLKERVFGPAGKAVDIFSVTVILFGVSTTLGRGALQINSGLKELLNIPFSSLSQGLIIVVVTAVATLSVVSGLNRGIRRLSELSVFLCLFLLFFVLFSGPAVFILGSFVEQCGAYLQNLMGGITQVKHPGSAEWKSQWTILYWAWWMAWGPFMGVFIARISEGRTVQQCVLAGLTAPVLLSLLWFTVFGGAAIFYETENITNLQPFLKTEYSILIFKFLELLPLGKALSFISLFTVVVFFVTSSDSASYVIHRISSKAGSSPVWGKIYWSVLEGGLALMMVFSGGIHSLELLVILATFPFAVLMVVIAIGLLKDLRTPRE